MLSHINTSKQNSILLILSAAFFLATSISHAEEQSIEQFVNQWLLNSCDVGEEKKPEKILAQFGAPAEDILLYAFKTGPNEKQLKDFQASRSKNWERRKALVNSEKIQALSKNDARLIKKTSRDEYIKRQTDLYKNRYQDRALQGLAIVGTIKSQKTLQDFVKKDKSLLNESAIKTLDAIKRRNTLLKQ